MVTRDDGPLLLSQNTFPSLASLPKNWVESQSVPVLDEKRQYPRLRFKVPVMVHDATGVLDCSISEDVSKSGFCFSSDRYYIVGEVLLVSIRCGFGGGAFQAYVRMVRREELGLTGRRLFGAYYLAADRESYFPEAPPAGLTQSPFEKLVA